MNSRRQSGFLKSYLTGLLLNVSWTEPAWVLLILHITFGVPLWLALAALTVWLVVVFLKTLLSQISSVRTGLVKRSSSAKAAFSENGIAPVPQREYSAYYDLLTNRDI